MQRIAHIETAIIEHIRAAKLEYLRFVGSYGGELAGDWQSVARRLPAVWITFKGATPPKALNTARHRWKSQYEYTCIVADRTLRAESATRHGHGPHPGTYQMLEDMHALLCMQDFGLVDVDYIQPGRVRSLYSAEVQGQAISVFAQDWITVVEYHLREPGQRAVDDTHSPTGYLPRTRQCPQSRTLAPPAHPGPAILAQTPAECGYRPAQRRRPLDPQHTHMRLHMMTVKAAPGLRVPMEHDPRRHITDSAPVSVEDSPYYRRRLKDGDVIRCDAPQRGTPKNTK